MVEVYFQWAMIALFKDFLQQLDSKFSSFKDEMLQMSIARDAKTAKLQEENLSLRKMIADQNVKIDEQDQYKRRESLVFSGDEVPSAIHDEDTTDIICSLINSKLGCNNIRISSDDVSISHRLGVKPNNGCFGTASSN